MEFDYCGNNSSMLFFSDFKSSKHFLLYDYASKRNSGHELVFSSLLLSSTIQVLYKSVLMELSF